VRIFLTPDTPDWMNWVALVISCLIGILVGGLSYKFRKIGFFIIGGIGGFFFALLIYNAFLHEIADTDVKIYHL